MLPISAIATHPVTLIFMGRRYTNRFRVLYARPKIQVGKTKMILSLIPHPSGPISLDSAQ